MYVGVKRTERKRLNNIFQHFNSKIIYKYINFQATKSFYDFTFEIDEK
jgi:hypothetical protein